MPPVARHNSVTTSLGDGDVLESRETGLNKHHGPVGNLNEREKNNPKVEDPSELSRGPRDQGKGKLYDPTAKSRGTQRALVLSHCVSAS